MTGLKTKIESGTLGLLFLWGIIVALIVISVLLLTEGRTCVGMTIHYDWRVVVLVFMLVGCDFLLRNLIYGVIPSISLDVVMFSLIARLRDALSMREDIIITVGLLLVIQLVIALADGVLFKWFQSEFREAVNKWLQPPANPAKNATFEVVRRIAARYIIADLWEVIDRDEHAQIRELAELVGGSASNEAPRLPMQRRVIIVIGLAVLPVLSLLVGALSLTSVSPGG